MTRSLPIVLLLSLAVAPVAAAPEPVVGLPCEGCGAVFVGLPDEIPAVSRLAPEDEPGEPLVLTGTVRDAEGDPVPGIVVYAYHTDARGIYPRVEALRGTPAYRHGALRGWARTDDEGRYRFDTIRPASYPDTRIPQHVHMHVIEPGRCTYYIDDVHFTDDPFLPDDERTADGRGGNGTLTPTRDEEGVWHAVRDIVLGHLVPGYPEETASP